MSRSPNHLSLVLALLAVACGDDAGESAVDASPSPGVDTGVDAAFDAADVFPEVSVDGPAVCQVDPDADTDGDGLPDVIEDADRNCRVDEGETDPGNPDTDGDGLADGQEDIDRNGRWDFERGELDPRSADTDGDGVADGDELVSEVCGPWLLSDASSRRRAFGDHVAYGPADPLAEVTVRQGGVLLGREGVWLAYTVSADLAPPLPVRLGGTEVVAASVRPAGWSAVFSVSAATDWWSVFAAQGLFLEGGEDSWGSGEVRFDVEQDDATSRWAALWVPDRTSDAPDRDDSGGEGSGGGDPEEPAGRPDWTEDWIGAVRAGSIVEASARRVRAACSESVTVAPVGELTLVLVVDTTGIGSGSSVLEAAEIVLSSTAEWVRLGGAASVFVVPADAHVGSGSQLLPMTRYSSIDAARAAIAGLDSQTQDVRGWSNAEAVLASLPSPRENERRVVVNIAAREDVDFRLGASDGREGHALGEPLPAGEQREGLTEYHASVLGAAASVIGLYVPNCADKETGASSLMDVALRSGGAFYDLCSDSGARLARAAVAEELGARVRWGVERAVLPNTLRIVTEDGSAALAPFGASSGDIGLFAAGLDVAAGYLYSEPVADGTSVR